MEFKKEEWKTDYIKKIGEALIERSETDLELAECIKEAECSIDDVFDYIRSEASKVAVNQCACIDCYTVYDMAVKFFKEGIWKEKGRVKARVEPKPSVNNEQPKKETTTTLKPKKEEKPKKQTAEDIFGGLF